MPTFPLNTEMQLKENNIIVTTAKRCLNSPRFPKEYPRNEMISWNLLSPPGTHIKLEFDSHFGLEDAENGGCW